MSAPVSEDHEGRNVSVVQINAGDDDGADITLDFNGKRIAVSLFANSIPQDDSRTQHHAPAEDRLIQLLAQAVTAPDDEYDELVDEVLDVILEVGKASFDQVAPSLQTPSPSHKDLHSHLYPETLDFRLQTIDGIPTVFPIRPDEANSLPEIGPEAGFDSEFQINDRLPQYSSKEIVVLQSFVSGNSIVSRVQVDGQEMLCKAYKEGLLNTSLHQELSSLQEVWKTYFNTGVFIRVPKLLGYARHADSGGVIGLLREWIPAGGRGRTLRHIDVSAVPKEMRQRWEAQIRETAYQLHASGLVWGDGKASNVIVDQTDNAWLIDFGGGWTEGWVDESLAGTVEGDDQAVRHIVKFLDL